MYIHMYICAYTCPVHNTCILTQPTGRWFILYLSTCLPVCLSVCPSFYPSMHPSIYILHVHDTTEYLLYITQTPCPDPAHWQAGAELLQKMEASMSAMPAAQEISEGLASGVMRMANCLGDLTKALSTWRSVVSGKVASIPFMHVNITYTYIQRVCVCVCVFCMYACVLVCVCVCVCVSIYV